MSPEKLRIAQARACGMLGGIARRAISAQIPLRGGERATRAGKKRLPGFGRKSPAAAQGETPVAQDAERKAENPKKERIIKRQIQLAP